jgi:hypothetical protein
MSYAINFGGLIDLGGFYSGGLPILTGSFLNPPLVGGSGAAFDTATSSAATPLTLTFSSSAVPPAVAFSVLVNDTTTGGDWVRSGVLTALPPSPDMPGVYSIPTIPISAAAVAMAAGTLLPPTIVPGWIRWLSGIVTAGSYIPLVAVLPAPTVTLGTGTLSVAVTGSLAVRVFYFGVKTFTFGLTTTVVPAPSADSGVPSRVLSMNPTLTSFVSAMSIIPGLGGFLASVVASQLEAAVNDTIVSRGHAVASTRGLRLTSTAIFSARRVTVLPSGITLQLMLVDLWGPAVVPIPGTLAVSITPPPQASVPHAYTVTVTNSVTGSPILGATLTLHNYDVHGTAASSTGTTNAAGQFAFNVTLHSKTITVTVSTTDTDDRGKPHREPERVTRTLVPTLSADAAGFNSVTLALL